jgi:hypothetical protein
MLLGERFQPRPEAPEIEPVPGVDQVGTTAATHRGGEITEVMPEFGGPFPPIDRQRFDRAAPVLGRTRGVEPAPCPPGPDRTSCRARPTVVVLVDGCGTRGEQPAKAPIDADDVAEPGGRYLPCHTEPAGEFEPESGVVDGLGRGDVGEEPATVDRRPGTVRALGDVGHHQVGVEVGIEGTARPVDELTGHHAGRRDQGDLPSPRPAHPHRPTSEVTDGLLHRSPLALADFGGHLPRRQQVEEAHRLGCAEGEVESGHAAVAA